MPKRHSLLARQLKRHFAGEHRLTPGFAAFAADVDAAYRQFDADRAMLERSLDLSSQELLSRNSEMRAMLQAFPDLFFRLDAKGVVKEFHASRTSPLALSEDPRGKTLRELLEPSLRVRVETELKWALATGGVSALEFPLGDAHGGVRHWEARFVRSGRAEVVAILRDITSRISAQDALKRSEAQLLNSQKMDAVGRLAGGIAHDFNNLLTAMIGLSALAIEELPEKHPAVDDLREVVQTGRRAAALTQQLLAFSSRQKGTPRLVSLNREIPEVVTMLRSIIGEEVMLELSLGQGTGLVRLDTTQLEQLVVNLAVNARDAMPKGGRLGISTESRGNMVALAISDEGVGMTEEVRQHAFEPFFTTKEEGRGTGLGLATCYGIAKQAGGRIEIESALGRGTTVTVLLPRAAGRLPDKAARDEGRRSSRGTEAVLVVEDKESVRRLAVKALRRAGYAVTDAADGLKGLEAVRGDKARKLRLVVTDVVMPHFDGLRLAAEIARLRPDVKVLFTSGHAGEAVLDPKAPLLAKPFTPAELTERVRQLLDGGR